MPSSKRQSSTKSPSSLSRIILSILNQNVDLIGFDSVLLMSYTGNVNCMY